MRQITLRTFFLSLYFFHVVLIVAFLLYTYQQYKRHHAESISERTIAVASSLNSAYQALSDSDNLKLIKPIIAEIPRYRTFITSVSLSVDGKTVYTSSDKDTIGQPLPKGITTSGRSITTEILHGNHTYIFPVQGTTALYALTISTSLATDPFINHLYTDCLIMIVVATLIFATVFFFVRRHLMLPLRTFAELILNHKSGSQPFMISDFTLLYEHLSDSYKTLSDKESKLESALFLKDYLYEILHTMDQINRVLISDEPTDAILNRICALLAEHGQYRLVWIGEVIEDAITVAAHSDDPHGYAESLHLSLNPDDPTSKGPSAQSILNNETVITPSVNLDSYALWRNQAKEAGFGSSICIPLRASLNDAPFGSLAIYSSKPFGFLNEEVTMLEDLAGDIGYTVATRRKQAELIEAITIDPLTGLFRRASLIEALQYSTYPRLLVMNINRFRDINSVYGFEIGDCLLRSLAERLKSILGPDEKLFRLHGDNFAVLFDEAQNAAGVHKWTETVAERIGETPFECGGIELWVSISAGYSDTNERTIENAEIALKEAKKHRTLLEIFSPSMRMSKEHEEHLHWYKIIRDAIKDDRFIPYFQGIVDNRTGKIDKYEALIRLIMPDGSVVAPFKFLDIAKKTGLYPRLTQIMVRKTIETFRTTPYTASINLSTEDIENSDIVNFLRDMITQSRIGKQIVFEILESEGITNYDKVIRFIDEFKQLGCGFAIDDFGSGFSNFEHLIKLQVDYLKIDGSLVKNLIHDKNAQVIVRNIQNFAAEMGIATIAEFVSSEDIYTMINEMGITFSQGYYFSEPRPQICQED